MPIALIRMVTKMGRRVGEVSIAGPAEKWGLLFVSCRTLDNAKYFHIVMICTQELDHLVLYRRPGTVGG